MQKYCYYIILVHISFENKRWINVNMTMIVRVNSWNRLRDVCSIPGTFIKFKLLFISWATSSELVKHWEKMYLKEMFSLHGLGRPQSRGGWRFVPLTDWSRNFQIINLVWRMQFYWVARSLMVLTVHEVLDSVFGKCFDKLEVLVIYWHWSYHISWAQLLNKKWSNEAFLVQRRIAPKN